MRELYSASIQLSELSLSKELEYHQSDIAGFICDVIILAEWTFTVGGCLLHYRQPSDIQFVALQPLEAEVWVTIYI